MATPTPTTTPTPLAYIESSAATAAAAAPPRKLPVKRKKTPPSQGAQAQPLLSSPDPLLAPDVAPLTAPDHSFDEDDDDYDYDDADEEDLATAANPAPIDVRSSAAAAAAGAAPPFRFQRVWSESDEIRLLQGLLGCWSQGLVFPRDLNIFFDRFSEPMPQPYTRSQLSEKLRRLRKKYRMMSARISRGQDPGRLAPHDRDVLHLCTRLWHPSHAASSPFSAPDALAPGSGGNKRRRPNPRAPSARVLVEAPIPPLAVLTPPPALLAPPPPPPADEKVDFAADGTSMNAAHIASGKEVKKEKMETEIKEPLPGMVRDGASGKDATNQLLEKTILDVFDACFKDFKATMAGQGLDTSSSGAAEGSDLEKRWREQRVAELDVLARRLRLVLENAIGEPNLMLFH